MGGHFWDQGGKRFRLEKKIEPRADKKFPATAAAIKVSGDTPKEWHREILNFIDTLKEKGGLTNLNQIAFLFRSVKNKRAVALAEFLEQNGVPVYSPRSNMFFDREEVWLMLGALIFLFPQIDLPIWEFYDNECVRPFVEAVRAPENKLLREWIIPLAQKHQKLAQNTDHSFADLFYELLQFPFSANT